MRLKMAGFGNDFVPKPVPKSKSHIPSFLKHIPAHPFSETAYEKDRRPYMIRFPVFHAV